MAISTESLLKITNKGLALLQYAVLDGNAYAQEAVGNIASIYPK